MSAAFKAGDVVQLKSGGPKMTVMYVGDRYGDEAVFCVWFEGPRKMEDMFPPETLVLA